MRMNSRIRMSGILLTSLFFIPTPSLQHWENYVEPCILAKVCNHSWTPICGRQPQSSEAKIFIDECDMFEYNCDNAKNYQQTELGVCHHDILITTASLTPAKTTQIWGKESVKSTASSTKPGISNVTNMLTNWTIATPKATITPGTATFMTRKTTVTAVPTPLTTTIDRHVECTRPTKVESSCLTTAPMTISITTPARTTSSTASTFKSMSTISTTTELSTTMKQFTTSTTATIYSTTTTPITELSTATEVKKPAIAEIKTKTTDTTVLTETAIISTTTELSPTTKQLTTATTANIFTTPITKLSTTTEVKEPATTEIKTTTSDTTILTQRTVVGPTKESTCGYKDTYPKDCNRPSTWETTSTGETRDFFQIIRALYGRRARFLRDTTNFPPLRQLIALKDYNQKTESFILGHHVDSYD